MDTGMRHLLDEIRPGLDRLLLLGTDPALVTISGPAGAGKSSIAKSFAEMYLADCNSISLDDYLIEQEARKRPGLLGKYDLVGYRTDMATILSAQPTFVPTYSQVTHRRGTDRLVLPRRLVIVEGVLANLPRSVRRRAPVSIYADAPPWIRVERQVMRALRDGRFGDISSDELRERFWIKADEEDQHIRRQALLADWIWDTNSGVLLPCRQGRHPNSRGGDYPIPRSVEDNIAF